jgi:hypothetical protein
LESIFLFFAKIEYLKIISPFSENNSKTFEHFLIKSFVTFGQNFYFSSIFSISEFNYEDRFSNLSQFNAKSLLE